MADKKGGVATDAIMSPAEMKPLLILSKREPVSAVVGMTKDHDGVILLSKRIKPKKLLAQLKADARKAKVDLDLTSLRFGKAEVDTDVDSGLVKFTINKDSPGALRMKLLELVKRVPLAKVEIDVDAKIEDEPEDDDAPPATAPTAAPGATPAAPDLHAMGEAGAAAVVDGAPTVSAGAAPTVPPPPDGVLERKGDGGVYWHPNPAPVTWGNSGGPAAPADWIDGFFAYYNLAPPPDPNPDATKDCTFNQEASALGAVLDMLEQQATLAGYTASRSAAQTAAQKLLADRTGGRQAGTAMAQHGPGPDDVAALEKLDTAALLDALEALRKARKLDALAKLEPADRRLMAAILGVQRHLGAKFQALLHALDDDDQTALRQHVYQGLIAGDVGDQKKLVKAGGGSFTSKDGSDAEWVDGFLEFYGLQADPFDDGMHQTCLFNGQTQSMSDVLDTVVEQAALDGRMIDRSLAMRVAMPMVSPPTVPGGSSHRITYYLGMSVIPWTGHVDLKSHKTSNDPPPGQIPYQFNAQVTLELHPENGSGPELSVVAQVSTNDDPNRETWQVTNYLGGFQAAWVKSWFDGALQLAPLVQVLGGAMQAQQAKDGSIKMVLAGQVMVGGQIAYQFDIPNSKMKMQIGVQAGGSATGAGGADPTLDGTIQFVAQVSF
jgi:hypothetical protein